MQDLSSDLMKFTVVNESLSINNLMFCKENNSTASMYYQQNEKYTQNNPTLTLHKCFLGFNLTYMSIRILNNAIIDCNSPHISSAWENVTNYSMVNYDLLKEQMQQNDENYPFALSIWLIILIVVVDTLMTATCIAAYWYYKYRKTQNKSTFFFCCLAQK